MNYRSAPPKLYIMVVMAGLVPAITRHYVKRSVYWARALGAKRTRGSGARGEREARGAYPSGRAGLDTPHDRYSQRARWRAQRACGTFL